MPGFEGRFISIVFLGRQNPQILNHDFLVKHGILPKDEEPFEGLFAKPGSQPFTEFISTPILTSIKYGPISLVVEEERYQITDNRFEDPPTSPIVQITKNYFGKHLKYTPLRLGGFNFNGIIRFADVSDELAFDDQLGIARRAVCDVIGSTDVRISVVFSFGWRNGIIEVSVPKPKERSQPARINFNYEFEYKGIESFLSNLDDIEQVYEKFNGLLVSLGVGGAR